MGAIAFSRIWYYVRTVIIIRKKEGGLLSALVERARGLAGVSLDIPITYAGRLDPMAEGIVLLLVGSKEILNKDKYLGLPKTYQFEVLFGVSTDTHDCLGVVNGVSQKIPTQEDVENIIPHYSGTIEQEYPLFSSKTVNGKPLFQYGRDGGPVVLPKHNVEVDNLKLLSFKEVVLKDIAQEALEKISAVRGDFRQEACTLSWSTLQEDTPLTTVVIASFEAVVSSGTYIRVLARDMGRSLDTFGLAFSITRTKIGHLTLEEGVEYKEFPIDQ